MNINEIGQIAHDINAGNGWETFRPEDWNAKNNDAEKIAAWTFPEAHLVTGNESQDGSPLRDYWSVFSIRNSDGKVVSGFGGSAEEATAHAHANVRKEIETRKLCTHMALIHSEVSEATEAIRHSDRVYFDEELADVVIRVASIAHGLGTDLDAAIRAKMEVNKTRGLRHGGKSV